MLLVKKNIYTVISFRKYKIIIVITSDILMIFFFILQFLFSLYEIKKNMFFHKIHAFLNYFSFACKNISLEEYQREFSIGNAEKASFDETECIFEILLIGSGIFLSKSLYERKNGAISITQKTQFRKEIYAFKFF